MAPKHHEMMLVLERLVANVSKLDEQMQCVRAALGEIQGKVDLLLEAHEEEEEDETDDEATHSTTTDDQSDTDLSFVVEDHSSSSEETSDMYDSP